MRTSMMAWAVLSWCLFPIAASAAPTVFADNFSRPDGPVGNGWVSTLGNVGGSLQIIDQKLSTSASGGRAGVVHPVTFYEQGLTVSATVTPTSGFGGLPQRFDTSFAFKSTNNITSGLVVSFTRGDANFSDSAVRLSIGGQTVAVVNSTFQFTDAIHPRVTLNPNGSIAGHVWGGQNTFSFSFSPQPGYESGSSFSIIEGFPDPRASVQISPTVDEVVMLSGGAKFSDLIANAVALTPSGNMMSATFTPNFGLSLEQAANAGGFDHFNWVQTVTEFPGSLFIVADGFGNPRLPLATPFNDPPQGGIGGVLGLGESIPADNLPFYWDEGVNPLIPAGYSLDDNSTANTLSFVDVPGTSFIPVLGDYMSFETALVGVYANGSWVPLETFAWKSDYNPLTDNGGVSRNISPLTGGTGGVFDVQRASSPLDVPDEVLALWNQTGAVFASTVPEPSTWAIMIFGFGFCGCVLRRRHAQRSPVIAARH